MSEILRCVNTRINTFLADMSRGLGAHSCVLSRVQGELASDNAAPVYFAVTSAQVSLGGPAELSLPSDVRG